MRDMRPIEGACAWVGRDMASSDRWVRRLSEEHIDELDRALAGVEALGLGWREITAADFPLPGMTDLIEDIRRELEDGSGIMKLKGLPVGNYSEERLQKLYYGLAVNIGRPVFQNKRGELMRFIRDEGGDVGKRYGQIEGGDGDDKPFLSSYARTLNNGALRFHTDRTDVVGLLCVRQAASGGVSRICSSVKVMNEMLDRHPDLAWALFEPICRSRLGEEAETADVTYDLPVFGIRDGRFTSHFSMTYIEAAQKVADVPRLTDRQTEALAMLAELANELAFDMRFEPGDIQLLNSHVTYHARTPFEDDKSTGHDRMLMRVWLAMPNSRALPDDHRVLWGNVDAGMVRGGIGQIRG